jgi:hypothetical protein
VHRAAREATLQHRIRLVMAERRPAQHSAGTVSLDPRDIVAQTRKRARMCAAHAPLSWSAVIKNPVRSEPMTGLNVHYMFYKTSTGCRESTGFSHAIFTHESNDIGGTAGDSRH